MRPNPAALRIPLVLATALFTGGLASAGIVRAQTASPAVPAGPIASPRPVVAEGVVPDEATKAAVLARLHALYGTERVVDRIEVDAVVAPPNWRARVVAMLGPDLQQISAGALEVDGNTVRISGQVANEAQRQQVNSGLATAAGPSYLIKSALRGDGPGPQDRLDRALDDRIVEFRSGSASLTGAGQALLAEIAAALQQIGPRPLQVIGHTDSVGPRAANIALSLARAAAVKAYFEQHGIAAHLISVQGLGPDRPVADNASAAGRARNRRIEFRVR
jgi:OmpA-OmpF porin, OOP family